MPPFQLNTDPMATDPGRWGHSLGNLAELWIPLLSAAAPRSILEIGAYAGDVTQVLLDWAGQDEVQIFSVDPDPQDALERLAEANPTLELIRAPSLEALPTLPATDAVIIDGDHNYYTVSQELRLIDERAQELPLIVCHDAGWPHARRDVYYTPELIPSEHRQPTVEGGYVFPGVKELHSGGLPYAWPALEEGGPRNGVLTAIEDFAAGRGDLRLAVVPAFFGLAVIWRRDAPWAQDVATALEEWDGNPLLGRLEANRVRHLAARELEAARAAWCEERSNQRAAFLHKLLASKAFAVAVSLSRLRRRGQPEFSKDEIRALLGD